MKTTDRQLNVPKDVSILLADWVLVTFRRVYKEMHECFRYVKSKRKSVEDLRTHVSANTFPRSFPLSKYKPPPNKKYPSMVVDWDKINLDHNTLLLKSLLLQQEDELKQASAQNSAEYYASLVRAECRETGRLLYGEMKDDTLEISPQQQAFIDKCINTGCDEIKSLFKSMVHECKLSEIESARKREAAITRSLNAQDRMEGVDEITPAMKSLINKMVDLKLKKHNTNGKNQPPKPQTKPAGKKKPPSRPPTPKQNSRPQTPKGGKKVTIKTPTKGKGKNKKDDKPKKKTSNSFNKNRSNYVDSLNY